MTDEQRAANVEWRAALLQRQVRSDSLMLLMCRCR